LTLFFRNLAVLRIDGAADTADDIALVTPLRRAFYSEDAFMQPRQRLTGDCVATSRECGRTGTAFLHQAL
jgi:hypothetical protein